MADNAIFISNKIHSLIQSSGLHYAINQTPFSSYITIRHKFILTNGPPISDLETADSLEKENCDRKKELAKLVKEKGALEKLNNDLKSEHDNLIFRNQNLEEI